MIFCYVYHWLSLYHCVSHTWKDVIQIGIQTPGRILLTSGCDAGRSSSSNTSTYTYTCGDHSSLKLREQSGCAVSEDVFNRKRFGEEVIWLLDWWMNWFDLGIDGFFELISVEFSMYHYMIHHVLLTDLLAFLLALFWLLCSVQRISIQLPP